LHRSREHHRSAGGADAPLHRAGEVHGAAGGHDVARHRSLDRDGATRDQQVTVYRGLDLDVAAGHVQIALDRLPRPDPAAAAAAAYRTAGFQSQENGSLCGPTTVVDAMASLGQPGTQKALLSREHLGIFGVIPGGLTLDSVADVLRKEQSRPVRVLRDLDLAA